MDLEEFLYKYYDLNELLKVKDKYIKKTKEYEVLKIKLMMKQKKILKKKGVKEIKEEKEEEGGWATESDEEKEKDELVETTKKEKLNLRETDDESDKEEVGPIVLANGELLLENGLT